MGVCDGQRLGSVFFLLVSLVVYGASIFMHQRPVSQLLLPWGEQFPTTLAVEIVTGGNGDGVYFVSEEDGFAQIIHRVGLADKRQSKDIYQKMLSTNSAITISENRGMVNVAKMSAVKRLALGLSIDLNAATVDELLMVPGIGPSTAIQIVQWRQSIGNFKALADLKKVPGIKDDRLKKLERYLYVSAAVHR